MVRVTDILSLTEFTRNAKAMVARVKESGQPLAITVNGTAEVVVLEARRYQELVDELERAQFVSAVRAGISEADRGESRDAMEFVAESREKYGL